LSSFSWLIVSIVAALDLCLPATGVQVIIRRVYTRVLDRDQELEDSLRILLPTNVESWRGTGCIRKLTTAITCSVKACCYKILEEHGLSQLNPAKTKDMEDFLVWLLTKDLCNFNALSVKFFAVVVGIGKAGVNLRIEGERTYETEPFVHYVESQHPLKSSLLSKHVDELKRGIGSAAQ
jgi:hypothetical protein